MIKPYYVAICQSERIAGLSGGLKKVKENAEKNLQRFRGLIDFVCGGPLVGRGGITVTGDIRLVTFGEFAITGHHIPADAGDRVLSNREIIDHLAIKIPGPETDMLAEKAKQYGTYIAASNYEYDPEWPDFYSNSAFIINPKGNIILKYRKTLVNNPVEMAFTAHDVMDKYKNPITGKYDPFPVVDTEIGRLAVMICADLSGPEIPRIYSMKGAEVVLHLTSGMSTSGGGIRAWGATEAAIQTRAYDNAVYFVNSNWGPELGAIYPRGRIAGFSKVYDFTGAEVAKTTDSAEQIVRAKIDIEAAREYRAQFFKNYLTMIRTELYAPYYNRTIYPPNTFLDGGAPEELLDEKHRKRLLQAKENLQGFQDFYPESGM
ncbi:nitrilase-related carbon-nitrogen hydrolase [Chloroflexota bacterium]